MLVWVFHFRESLTITDMSVFDNSSELRQFVEDEYIDTLLKLKKIETLMGNSTAYIDDQLRKYGYADEDEK